MAERPKARDLYELVEYGFRNQRHTLDAVRAIHEKADAHRVYGTVKPACAICIVLDGAREQNQILLSKVMEQKRQLGFIDEEGDGDGGDEVVRDLPDDPPVGDALQPDP